VRRLLPGFAAGISRADGVAGGYVAAAILMLGAALIEAVYGIDAEGRSLEKIAEPANSDTGIFPKRIDRRELLGGLRDLGYADGSYSSTRHQALDYLRLPACRRETGAEGGL
jgi:hypothetical protein